ncbi:MAG: DUF1122 family protein [Aquificaceae bacterium]|nr:DUF1122 family protein [Aquificaceae bacterium]MCX8164882.1 DUF1122 family protein [Aquificaceae bacterium]
MEAFKEELSRVFCLSKVTKGRFVEEENITLEVLGRRIMHLKAFYGRKPYWKEWVELFHIDPEFFGSELEDKLYRILSRYFRRIFVEYYEDKRTLKELISGMPPEKTRLGLKLLALGYRFFKDWYYPEGWMEGGCKLQAEK